MTRMVSLDKLNRAIDVATIRMCRLCVRAGYINRADGVIASTLIREAFDQLRLELNK